MDLGVGEGPHAVHRHPAAVHGEQHRVHLQLVERERNLRRGEAEARGERTQGFEPLGRAIEVEGRRGVLSARLEEEGKGRQRGDGLFEGGADGPWLHHHRRLATGELAEPLGEQSAESHDEHRPEGRVLLHREKSLGGDGARDGRDPLHEQDTAPVGVGGTEAGFVPDLACRREDFGWLAAAEGQAADVRLVEDLGRDNLQDQPLGGDVAEEVPDHRGKRTGVECTAVRRPEDPARRVDSRRSQDAVDLVLEEGGAPVRSGCTQDRLYLLHHPSPPRGSSPKAAAAARSRVNRSCKPRNAGDTPLFLGFLGLGA